MKMNMFDFVLNLVPNPECDIYSSVSTLFLKQTERRMDHTTLTALALHSAIAN